jgi:hypothetical protein
MGVENGVKHKTPEWETVNSFPAPSKALAEQMSALNKKATRLNKNLKPEL